MSCCSNFSQTFINIFYFYSSHKSKEFWNDLCERKMGYAFVASLWLVPTILTGLPKYLEADVTFRPGHGNELGYLCYPVEISNKTEAMTWLTQLQFDYPFSSIDLILYNLYHKSKYEHLEIFQKQRFFYF